MAKVFWLKTVASLHTGGIPPQRYAALQSAILGAGSYKINEIDLVMLQHPFDLAFMARKRFEFLYQSYLLRQHTPLVQS